MSLRWILLLSLLFWAGCAPRLTPQDDASAHRLWLGLHHPTPVALTAQLSIHMEGPQATGRVRADLTGVLAQRLRLDIVSSLGSTLAMVEETPQGVLAYEPQRDTATVFLDPQRVFPAQGIPLPLSLGHIARLLAGDWGPLLPQGFAGVDSREGAIAFTLPGGTIQEVVVATDGSWVRALGHDDLEIVADLPAMEGHYTRFTFVSGTQGSAVVRVKAMALEAPVPSPLIVPETARIEIQSP